MNKALRHKSGQVFINALGSDFLKSGNIKANSGPEKASLEDEEAVLALFKRIDEEKKEKGDLR